MVQPLRGLIFDVQRFSIHDGGGIRTLVFLKGCPLRCLWCCNPESQRGQPELMLFPARCIGCGRCLEACPQGAVVAGGQGTFLTDRALCVACGTCAETCPANARALRGRSVTVEELLREVERDRVFYSTSGGGVTVSGGEPLLQAAFVAAFLRACKSRAIDTAVETCGHVAWSDLALVLPYVDAFLYDVKHLDSTAHRRLTGVGNELILANLRHLAKEGVPTIIRMPLVPGANTDAESVRAVAQLARKVSAVELHLLPYHRFGEAKYSTLGRGYPLDGVAPLSAEAVEALREIAVADCGLPVRVGG
jgi:pyruvate formate lyase activating enzyme